MLGEQAYGILNTAVNGRIKNAHVLGVLVARTEDLDRSELPEAISLVGQAVAKRAQPDAEPRNGDEGAARPAV